MKSNENYSLNQYQQQQTNQYKNSYHDNRQSYFQEQNQDQEGDTTGNDPTIYSQDNEKCKNISKSPIKVPYNQEYTTSINELISEPAGESIYTMEHLYKSVYDLSSYLWNKKFMARYNPENDASQKQEISFDEYLQPLQQELSKYGKFKRSKSKQEQNIRNLSSNERKVHSNTGNIQKVLLPTIQTELVKCYQQVPFIYFEQTFTLDFSNFQDKNNTSKYNNVIKMQYEQEQMNDNLDLIEINLFGQIHRKFEEYFKVATNFDYLTESIAVQLEKLQQARKRVSRVQSQFVVKSQKLRKHIIQRNNIEKVLKKMKLLKSLKKLPSIIQNILQSSLPYECLELLSSTKKSVRQLQSIKCVQSIVNNIKTSQTIVQLGLNKRYTDQLYLYVQEVFKVFDFEELFKKVTADTSIIEKEHNSVMQNLSRRSQINNSTSFRAGDRSGYFVLQELGEGKGTNSFNGKPLLKNNFAKRQQGKQYEIAMILLQSYQYVDFPVDVTKIKISNGLRVICRKYEKDLIVFIKREVQKTGESREKSLLDQLSIDQQNFNDIVLPVVNQQKEKHEDDEEDSPEKVRHLIEQVSIQSYIKLIKILNELFKQILNRYLGYVLTLITEYEQKLSKLIVSVDRGSIVVKKSSTKSIEPNSQKEIPQDMQLIQSSLSQKRQSSYDDIREHQSNSLDGKSSSEVLNNEELSISRKKSLQKSQKLSKMQQSHLKFKSMLVEELSLLPSIFKIIQEKIKHFLNLKNISNASPQQFFQWISLLRFWQRWFDVLVQESPLINYKCTYLTSQTQISSSTQLLTLGQDMIEELICSVFENVNKSINTMSLKSFITQITINYLNAYTNTVSSELYQCLEEETWQNVQIPQQFSEILNGIVSKGNENQNMSITVLNTSAGKLSESMNKSKKQLQKSINSSAIGSISSFKFKILKNNIVVDGQRYKLTMSFLLLCEFIEQFVRIGKLFEGITGENDQQSCKQSKHVKKILSHLYQKIYEFIEMYNKSTKEMILQKKVLKNSKIKGNISVKHLCLLSNCLTFLEKITKQIPIKDLLNVVSKKQRQNQTVHGLQTHNQLLIDKISSILNKKMEQTVVTLKVKQKQKNNSEEVYRFVLQSNQSIATIFMQTTQIIDEYLDIQKCQKILKQPFQVFVQRYFGVVIQKGEKYMEQSKILLQKIKFLRKYFKNQFVAMQRELS